MKPITPKSKRLLVIMGSGAIVLLVSLLTLYQAGYIFVDYDDPSYRDYLERTVRCNSFYGGPSSIDDVNSQDPAVYRNWQQNRPIPC